MLTRGVPVKFSVAVPLFVMAKVRVTAPPSADMVPKSVPSAPRAPRAPLVTVMPLPDTVMAATGGVAASARQKTAAGPVARPLKLSPAESAPELTATGASWVAAPLSPNSP